MKFDYSPGLLGYGLKGSDGSLGLSGASVYFTDYYIDDDIIYHNNTFYFKMKYITKSLTNDIIYKLILKNSYNYISFHGTIFS